MTRDGKPIPPPEKYQLVVFLASPDGTIHNKLELTREDLASGDVRITGVADLAHALEFALYGIGEQPKADSFLRLQVAKPLANNASENPS